MNVVGTLCWETRARQRPRSLPRSCPASRAQVCPSLVTQVSPALPRCPGLPRSCPCHGPACPALPCPAPVSSGVCLRQGDRPPQNEGDTRTKETNRWVRAAILARRCVVDRGSQRQPINRIDQCNRTNRGNQPDHRPQPVLLPAARPTSTQDQQPANRPDSRN